MHLPQFLARRRALRWLVPVGVAGAAALAATGAFNATASSEALPKTTPAALLADVRHAGVPGFSGTVVSRLSLGLPDLTTLGVSGSAASLASLLSGSHTLQVWNGGRYKQRVALLGSTDETDVFRNGSDVWQWSSADQVAVHSVLSQASSAGAVGSSVPSVASITPADLAHTVLAALDSDTRVVVEDDRTVADRAVYELVLTPRSDVTKIRSVHVAVDGSTKIPLGVQVYARGARDPAVDVAFTSIRFAHQAARNFDFSPPSSATVRDLGSTNAWDDGGPAATRTGTGWTTVFGLRPGRGAITNLGGALLDALPAVSGSWGKGRLFDSSLLSVLVTNDGRVYAGAVAPRALYAAAAK